MPIHLGKDSKGPFVQWGHRTKYHYKANDKASLNRAKAKAKNQMKAIFANGYIGLSNYNIKEIYNMNKFNKIYNLLLYLSLRFNSNTYLFTINDNILRLFIRLEECTMDENYTIEHLINACELIKANIINVLKTLEQDKKIVIKNLQSYITVDKFGLLLGYTMKFNPLLSKLLKDALIELGLTASL